MVTSNLDVAIDVAKKKLEKFNERSNGENVMEQHADAMACRDCEAFLDAGIVAFEWLQRADRILREAAKEGIDVDENTPNIIGTLYRVMLRSVGRAQKLIAEHQAKGYELDNLDRFLGLNQARIW